MIRTIRRPSPLLILVLCLLVAPSVLAHQPAHVVSARADVRVDDQRGLRVRVWFEVPDARAGDVTALRDHLAGCLPLSAGGEALPGGWARGDDPKDGLSNGSHTLMALEFEPAEPVAQKRLELTLRIECFGGEDLSLAGNVRARLPWQVLEAFVPEAAVSEDADAGDHRHGHDTPRPAKADDASRTLRVVFERSE